MAGRGSAWQGVIRPKRGGNHFKKWLGEARLGQARLGEARQGAVGQPKLKENKNDR